jgi:hypothetical protein
MSLADQVLVAFGVSLLIVLVAAVAVAGWKTLRRMSEHRYRFSNKALLSLVGLAACLCGGLRILFTSQSGIGMCVGLGVAGASLGALLGYSMRGARAAVAMAVVGVCTVSVIVALLALAEYCGWGY